MNRRAPFPPERRIPSSLCSAPAFLQRQALNDTERNCRVSWIRFLSEFPLNLYEEPPFLPHKATKSSKQAVVWQRSPVLANSAASCQIHCAHFKPGLMHTRAHTHPPTHAQTHKYPFCFPPLKHLSYPSNNYEPLGALPQHNSS